MADDDLCARFQAGDTQALDTLLTRYRRFARAKARGYFLVGADADDLEQEGLIGLFKAARDFRPDRQSSFRAFAELCVKRQVITAIKTATRLKHKPLNGYVSISPGAVAPGNDADESSLEELLRDHWTADPADEVVNDDRLSKVRQSIIELLSSLEVEVLRLYAGGASYAEISEQLNRHTKAVDNAIQRIKRKVEGLLAQRDIADQLAEAALLAS
jgi:RNA polymerase sporulation-specific sigma factor